MNFNENKFEEAVKTLKELIESKETTQYPDNFDYKKEYIKHLEEKNQ